MWLCYSNVVAGYGYEVAEIVQDSPRSQEKADDNTKTT